MYGRITGMQMAHSLSDFLVFAPQMLAQPVFIFHHAILAIVSAILPLCPGCVYVVTAFAIAEFGSGAIGMSLPRHCHATPVFRCSRAESVRAASWIVIWIGAHCACFPTPKHAYDQLYNGERRTPHSSINNQRGF